MLLKPWFGGIFYLGDDKHIIKSSIWMSGALASFCLMAVGGRELSGDIPTSQILFYRSVIGLTAVSVIILFTRKSSLFLTARLGLHSVRNVFHFSAQYGWFLGLGLLPLAEVFALEFTVPFWTALIACCFLKERLTVMKFTSILLGLLGVIVIVSPGKEIVNYASLIVLAAAVFFAVSHASTKSLSSSEDPLTILFFMCLMQLPMGFLLSLFNWQYPSTVNWFWLTIVGFTALFAHYCMTKAMQYAEVTSVVTLDFFRLPMIAVVGIVFYSENFEIGLLFGALLMLIGNLLNIRASKTE